MRPYVRARRIPGVLESGASARRRRSPGQFDMRKPLVAIIDLQRAEEEIAAPPDRHAVELLLLIFAGDENRLLVGPMLQIVR